MIEQAPPKPTSRLRALRVPRIEQVTLAGVVVPVLVALATVAATCFTLWFYEYEPDLDALGLFNAAYTALKTGHTTYPIYAYPTEMVVHPPTHYWMLAQIMRVTGWTGQAAALVPIGFWVGVAALLAATSRWRPTVKLAMVLATWLAVVVWAPPNYIRPDVAVAAAWIAGLIGLETGRIGGWRLWRLAVGSLAIAYASILHYPASLAVAGVLVYVGLAAWRLRGRARLRTLGALVVPAGVILIAYALIFVFPHYEDIKYVTSHQNAQGHGLFAAFDQTRQEYFFFARTRLGGPVITFLMWPALHWGIPAALLGPAALLLFRQTRAFALASIPFLFTLLFYAREKTYYYYAPDVFIYFAGGGVAVLAGAESLVRRLRLGRPLLLRTATALAATAAVVVVGALAHPALARFGTFNPHPLHADMDVARAAGSRMVSPTGTVLMNDVALWYVTGANSVYYPRDLDESLDVRGSNLEAYLGRFAAVAEESYDTWTTQNAQHLNISSLILNGTLHINGFYFGRNWQKTQPTIVRYFLTSVHQKPMEGYAWDGTTVSRFAAARAGAWSLLGAVCASTSPPIPGTSWQTTIFLPGAADNTLSIVRYFRIGLVGPGVRTAAWSSLRGAGCKRVFEQRLARTDTQPVGAFLSAWRRTPRAHTTISFPQAEAAKTSALYRPTAPTHVTATVDLDKASGFGSTPTEHQDGTLVVSSPAARFNSLFQTPLPDPGTPRSWIRVRLQVEKGLIGLCSQNTTEQGCRGMITVAAGPPQTLYLRAGSAAPHLGLYVDNRGPFASTVRISSIQVVAAGKP